MLKFIYFFVKPTLKATTLKIIINLKIYIMKMLRVTLLVLLAIVTFDVANASSFHDHDRRDRERRRQERWERRHHHDRDHRDRGGRDHGYRDYNDRY